MRKGGQAGERGRRVTAEANCVPFLSEVLRAGVKLRVALPRHSGWALVPVLNGRQRVCARQRVFFVRELRGRGAGGTSVSDPPRKPCSPDLEVLACLAEGCEGEGE